jgi:hypothetical protein
MSVALRQSVVPTFGRHETFSLRFSWLKRGYDLIADPDLIGTPEAWRPDYYPFLDENVHHTLGVGKNMARSIRFWLQACRIIEEVRPTGRRNPVGLPTAFGVALLDSVEGLDPYLEDAGTWWLLHWMMVSPGSYLPVWWVAFHEFNALTFNADQLLEQVEAQVEATSNWNKDRLTITTLRRDVLALLRTYAGTSGLHRRGMIDDELDAPFVPLTLIRATDGGGYRFGLGPKPGLSPAVAAFASLDFLSRTQYSGRQVLVATLATEAGGPGRAFKLREEDLSDLLTAAAERWPELMAIGEVGGSRSLSIHGSDPLGLMAARILQRSYQALGSRSSIPDVPYLPWSTDTEFSESRRLLRREDLSWT